MRKENNLRIKNRFIIIAMALIAVFTMAMPINAMACSADFKKEKQLEIPVEFEEYYVVHLVENKDGKYEQHRKLDEFRQERLDPRLHQEEQETIKPVEGIVNKFDYDFYTPTVKPAHTKEDGTLVVEILYKRNKVAFSAGEISFEYDGQPHTNNIKYYIHNAGEEKFNDVKTVAKQEKVCGDYKITFADKKSEVKGISGKKYFVTSYTDGIMKIKKPCSK